jgi:hypothetical protein
MTPRLVDNHISFDEMARFADEHAAELRKATEELEKLRALIAAADEIHGGDWSLCKSPEDGLWRQGLDDDTFPTALEAFDALR